MSDNTMDTRQLIIETANRILSDHCDKALLDEAEKGIFPEKLWQLIAENGFNLLGCESTETDSHDMFAFIKECGRFAVPLPIAETLLVNYWCGEGDGLYSIGEVDSGRIVDIPWGRAASKVVGIQKNSLEVLVVDSPEILEEKTNIAGEPRDIVRLPEKAVSVNLSSDPYIQLALSRTALIAGCLQTILNFGLEYADERSQFGKALSKFQVIQHSLALSAAEVAASLCAAKAAIDASGTDRFIYEVAAGKSRVGEAVTIVTDYIHQIHGAMGFTHEHRLHHYTRRAWAWRDEWGNEFYWQSILGKKLADIGADNVWDFIATPS